MARGAAGLEPALAAFDREAGRYDAGFGRSPAGLLFRRVFQERLRRAFAAGAHVLDLGCGTGEDAVALAAAGVRVYAIDPAPAMVQRARSKARALGIPSGRLRFEQRRAEECFTGEVFDGAYSDFGALSCADLVRVGEALARALRPGAPVILSLLGRRPLPARIHGTFTGRGRERGQGQPRVAGLPVPTWYATAGEARVRLGPAFAWRGALALGVLVPGPDHDGWAGRNPQAFGLLAALEGLVRSWPLLRGLGDHVVLEGTRR